MCNFQPFLLVAYMVSIIELNIQDNHHDFSAVWTLGHAIHLTEKWRARINTPVQVISHS